MTSGYLSALETNRTQYATRSVEVAVQFSSVRCTISTLEGPVECNPGDAIVTGVANEQWPVPRVEFDKKYEPAEGQSTGSPGRYVKRTAYVQAAQLEKSISIALSDARGTLQGQAGDWIVWYAPDDAAIVAKDIFSKLYKPA
jgi:hypothetical protein